MTKKDKQPRDETGKFVKQTPMVALHSKDGSTAYFSSVEEMERFTKANNVVFKEKEPDIKNPDCEPATKGYVKCLMRKTRNHTHYGRWDGNFTTLAMCGGWFSSLLFGACCFSIDKALQNIGNQYFIPVLLFSIAMTCMYCEFMKLEYTNVEGLTPPELKKYTPPTCEKKDECD
jgi:hypothetical protein